MNLTLTLAQAKTVRRALSHLRENARTQGESAYFIDVFCRADTVERLEEIIAVIDARLPKNKAKK